MQIQLFTRNGERAWALVAELTIPPFEPAPSVIVCGARTFQVFPPPLTPGDGVTPAYGEVFGYTVPNAARA